MTPKVCTHRSRRTITLLGHKAQICNGCGCTLSFPTLNETFVRYQDSGEVSAHVKRLREFATGRTAVSAGQAGSVVGSGYKKPLPLLHGRSLDVVRG